MIDVITYNWINIVTLCVINTAPCENLPEMALKWGTKGRGESTDMEQVKKVPPLPLS